MTGSSATMVKRLSNYNKFTKYEAAFSGLKVGEFFLKDSEFDAKALNCLSYQQCVSKEAVFIQITFDGM